MNIKRIGFLTLLTAILVFGCAGVTGETWRLAKGEDWQGVSGSGEEKYVLRVSEIKRQVNRGEAEAVLSSLRQLKADYPEIAGADLDAFMEGELLFAKGKLVKAVRSYDKFIAGYPGSGLYEAALDREYSIASAFLGGQKIRVLKMFKMRGYAEGERIMERISERAGDGPLGEKAALAVVRSLEERKKFNEAYQKWSAISSRWPGGAIDKDALLGMARCKHAAYEGPKHDSSSLISAKSYYENFKLRYPKEAKELGIAGRIEQINEQMAYKQYGIGQYYEKSGNMQSANLYYQMVLDDWPGSTAAKMVKQKGIKN